VSDRATVDWGAAQRDAIDRELSKLCDRYSSELGPRVGDTVRYALLGGGKRLRGLFVAGAYRSAGGSRDATPLARRSVVHAYSLIRRLRAWAATSTRRRHPTTHARSAFASPRSPAWRWFRSPRVSYRAGCDLGLADADAATVTDHARRR
jgi:hypothetical protein